MTPENVILEISHKWEEHIEMADDKSAVLSQILANLLIKERLKSEYLENRIKLYERVNNVSF